MSEAIYAGIDFDLPTLVNEESEKKLEEYEKQMQRYKDEEAQKRYEKSGVPQKFWKESFETYEVSSEQEIKAYDTVRNFADKPNNRVLILCGENGTGKSHLGSSVIRQYGGEYITSSMLCIKYDSATGYKADMTREQILLHFSTVKMLVIDECCKYFLDEKLEKFLLMLIICMRYENNLPTILITNGNKQPFIQFLGKAVYDRLTEVCTTIEFNGESKRKFAREEYVKPASEEVEF